ncbi:MAG: hypothetical protein JOZ54_07610 [Acidobacteria bacterium]|nr:hypothetical protein [Acidobacteriota bacterium]
MAFAPDTRRALIALAATLATAAAAFYGTGMHPAWPMLWFAPLPMLVLAPRVSGRTSFALSAIAWFLGGMSMWTYFMSMLGRNPVPLTLVILGVPSLVFALGVVFFRWLLLRGHSIAAALAFPTVWTSYQYLSEITSLHSTFGNLAYTQMNFLPILQIAAITGIWGITFALFAFSAAIATLLARPTRALAIGAAAFFVAVFGYGAWRLNTMPNANTVTVGLIASDLKENVDPQEPPDRLLRDYATHATKLAGNGAQVIVMPEKLAVVVDPETRVQDAALQEVADRSKTDLVVGVIRVAKPVKYNEARVYTSGRTDVLAYDKQHMLPPWESKLTPGTTTAVMQKPSGTWGVAICKDLDFPDLGRKYGKQGVGLMLVPAWDFEIDGWHHGRMSVLRGIESGYSIARAPKNGLLTVSDSRGRILAEASSGASGFTTLLAKVPIHHESTLYLRFGDWFAWLVLALLVTLLLVPFLRRAER